MLLVLVLLVSLGFVMVLFFAVVVLYYFLVPSSLPGAYSNANSSRQMRWREVVSVLERCGRRDVVWMAVTLWILGYLENRMEILVACVL